jgi:hypothetical protein
MDDLGITDLAEIVIKAVAEEQRAMLRAKIHASGLNAASARGVDTSNMLKSQEILQRGAGDCRLRAGAAIQALVEACKRSGRYNIIA